MGTTYSSFCKNNHAKVGAHIGLPISDFSNYHTFNIGVDFQCGEY